VTLIFAILRNSSQRLSCSYHESMPTADFFCKFGLFAIEGFFNRDLCSQLCADVRAGSLSLGLIGSGTATQSDDDLDLWRRLYGNARYASIIRSWRRHRSAVTGPRVASPRFLAGAPLCNRQLEMPYHGTTSMIGLDAAPPFPNKRR
jgi:hypothetical protein